MLGLVRQLYALRCIAHLRLYSNLAFTYLSLIATMEACNSTV